MLSFITSQALQTYLVEADKYHPSPLRLRLSGIAGSTSLACWFVLILPQLIEQWRLKSVDGISPLFLVIWASGDVANLIGSLSAGLLPEVILTAVWFFFSDGFVLCFYAYIKYVYPKHHPKHKRHSSSFNSTNRPHDEETPLLTEHNIVDVDSRRRLSQKSNRSRRASTLDEMVLEPENHSLFVRYVLPIGFIILCGTIGSFCSPNKAPENPNENIALFPQICGYISAFLYLTARLPQIYRNYRKQSCEGLSLLFFMLSTLGNTTYGLQILFYRSDWDYVKLNASWLLGSLGTITEDAIIFYQFYLYNEISTTEGNAIAEDDE